MLNDQQVPNILDPMVPPGERGGPPFEVASFVESVGRIQKISPKWLATGHKLYTFPNKPARHLLPTINNFHSQKSSCFTIMRLIPLMVNFAVVLSFKNRCGRNQSRLPRRAVETLETSWVGANVIIWTLMKLKIPGDALKRRIIKGQCFKRLPMAYDGMKYLVDQWWAIFPPLGKNKDNVFFSCFSPWQAEIRISSVFVWPLVDHIFRRTSLTRIRLRVFRARKKRGVKWCTWDDGRPCEHTVFKVMA